MKEVQFELAKLKEDKPKPWEGSYVCPVEASGSRKVILPYEDRDGNTKEKIVTVFDDPHVSKDYCDTFNLGNGCRFKDFCPAYQLANFGKTIEPIGELRERMRANGTLVQSSSEHI